MPSPRAVQRTAAHRRDLARVSASVAVQVNRAARMANPSDIDAWWARVSPAVLRTVARGHDIAAALARRYMEDHAALEGVRLDPVRVAADRREMATSLLVTGPVAFKTNMARTGDPGVARRVMGSQLVGAAQRLTLAGDRATVMGTFRESEVIAGWRRVGGGCAFCTMLISRGAVYSKDTADFQAHDRCRCSAEPLYEREPEPESVRRLQEQWGEATEGVDGPRKLLAWRDYLAAQQQGAALPAAA